MTRTRSHLSETKHTFFYADTNKKNMKILIVDDHLDKHCIMRDMLMTITLNETSIHHAYNGTMALEVIKNSLDKNKNYDVIIMDYHMPKLNGEKTTKLIREFENLNPYVKPSLIITWSTIKNKPYPLANAVLPFKSKNAKHLAEIFSTLNLPIKKWSEIAKATTIPHQGKFSP